MAWLGLAEVGTAPALDTSKVERKHNDTVIKEAPTERVPVRFGFRSMARLFMCRDHPHTGQQEVPAAAAAAPAKPAPEPEVDRTCAPSLCCPTGWW
jgi:hypothetical protein